MLSPNKVEYYDTGIANEQPTHEWQKHRKIWLKITRYLQTSNVSMEHIISRDVNKIISILESSKGDPIDISRTVQMALCNIICTLCFGKSFPYNDPTFQHLLKMADKFFHYLSSASAVNFFPILWYLPLKANKVVAEGYEGIFSFVKKLVVECRKGANTKQLAFIALAMTGKNGAKESEADESDGFPSANVCAGTVGTGTEHSHNAHGCKNDLSFPDVFTKLEESGNTLQMASGRSLYSNVKSNGSLENDFDIDEVCESVTFVATDLFIGGAETTHAGVMWALVFMILNPDAQARVQLEIDEVVGNQRLPTWEDRHNLSYTQVKKMSHFMRRVAMHVHGNLLSLKRMVRLGRQSVTCILFHTALL